MFNFYDLFCNTQGNSPEAEACRNDVANTLKIVGILGGSLIALTCCACCLIRRRMRQRAQPMLQAQLLDDADMLELQPNVRQQIQDAQQDSSDDELDEKKFTVVQAGEDIIIDLATPESEIPQASAQAQSELSDEDEPEETAYVTQDGEIQMAEIPESIRRTLGI